MESLLLIVFGFIGVMALLIWVLSKLAVPLLKAGISLVMLIFIGGVVVVVAFVFWAMGMYAFLFIGLILLCLILNFMNFKL